MKHGNCGNCAFSYFHDHADYGECRIYPPGFKGFPQVNRFKWCGKWTPAHDDNPEIQQAWEEFKTFAIMKGDKSYCENEPDDIKSF